MSCVDDQDLAGQVRSGLDAGAFSAYFQPKFDADSEDIVGLEALLRWRHPDDGLQDAGLFMSAVERIPGLAEQVDAWVLHETTHQAQAWLDQGVSFGVLNVNISAWHNTEVLVTMVEKALHDSGFPAKSLALECPWRMLAVDVEGISKTMRALRALGCVMVLDGNPLDQGCLDVVRSTPVQMSKICIEHMQHILETDGIGALSKLVKGWQKQKVQIVSVGVESEDDLDLSHKAGCRMSQGSRFKSPLPSEEITFLLKAIDQTKKALSII